MFGRILWRATAAPRSGRLSSSSTTSTTNKPRVVAIVCDSAANCRTALTHALSDTSDARPLDVNALTVNGKNALLAAIGLSDEHSVRLLLTHRVSPSLPLEPRGGEWPILAASRHGLVSVVKLLLDAGANVNTVTSDGTTPLTTAIAANHVELVSHLIAAGAHLTASSDVDNSPTNAGLAKFPPLLCAISSDRPAIVRTLLLAGCDPRTRSSAGPSALMLAAANKSTAMSNMLIEFGLTHDDLCTDLCNAATEGSLNAVQGLLAVGADPNARLSDGVPVLLWAVARQQWDLARVLVAAKADVNCVAHGLTPLLICASHAFDELVPALLAANADIEALESNGATPLVRAAQFGHESIVRALLAAGANVDHKEHDGATGLMLAAQNGHLGIVQALLDARADPNAASPELGTTALLLASQNGHLEVVQALLGAGAVTRASKAGAHTALQMAATNGHVSVIGTLLEAGADVNEAVGGGLMALGLAAGNGHIAAMSELLRGGADINQRTNDGATPLIMASYFGHARAVQALVDAGANSGVAMGSGETAFAVAVERGHREVAAILAEN